MALHPAFRLLTGVALAASAGLASAESIAIDVAKTATCGCCSAWIEHLEDNGFAVSATDVSHEQLNGIKAELDIQPQHASCHTAMVDGYFIEGHVHADEIKDLLAERPDGRGLTVPGMPIGSPGMEVGDQQDAYATYLVRSDNSAEVFEQHNQ